MRLLPKLLIAFAALVVLEVAVNVLLRPQVGPAALAAAFEPHLLAVGAVAAVLAVLMTLGDRGSGASRLRLVAIVVLVVAIVRLGGEWWSPDPGAGTGSSGTDGASVERLGVMTWNLDAGSKTPETTVAGILDAKPAPELVALQELMPAAAAAIDADPAIARAYPYRILEPGDGVSGMGLLSRYPLVVGGSETEPVVQTAQLLLPDGARIEVLNVHPFPPDVSRAFGVLPVGLDTRRRDEDLSVLAAKVDQVDDRGHVLLVGDLNTSPFEPGFGKISAGLLDAHTEAGTGTGFTWRPTPLQVLHMGVLRIDHVLTGADLRPVAVSEDCSLPGDHCRLSATLVVSTGK